MPTDTTIRHQVEDMIGFPNPVTLMTKYTMMVGNLDGMGQSGLWIRPTNLMYIPFTDIISIRAADSDEVE